MRRPLPRINLQTRLYLLLMMAVLPIIIFLLISFFQERRGDAEHAKTTLVGLTQLMVTRNESIIESTRDMLSLLSRLPSIQTGTNAERTALFKAMLAEYPRYGSIGLADPQGNVIANTLDAAPPVNISDRQIFQIASQQRKFAVSDYVVGRLTHLPVLVCSQPLMTADNRLSGVLFASLKLDWINSYPTQSLLPAGTVFILTDRNGVILANSQESEKHLGQVMPSAAPGGILRLKPGQAVELSELDGQHRMYVLSAVTSSDGESLGYAIAGLPTSEIYSPTRKKILTQLPLAGLVVVGLIIVAASGGRFFVLHPVNTLVSAAEQFSRGNLNSRVGFGQGAGEFERIGRAFDGMAATLEKREAERNKLITQLKQTNEELQALLYIADDVINSPNLDSLLQTLLRRLLEIIKADAGTILLYEDDRLHVRASIGVEEEVRAGYSIGMGEGFVGTIAATMQPLYVADAQSDRRILSPFIKQSGIRSMLGVPMKDRGKLIGVIHLDWMELHPEDEHELRLLEITADRCAMAIVNQGLFESVKKNEERLRLAAAAGRMGTWDADLKTNKIAWSPVMEHILGFKPGEFLGTYDALLEIIHPDDRQGFVEARNRAIRGEAEYRMEVRFVRPDGQICWGLLLGQVLHDEQGQPARLIGINLDITVRKQSEEALRQQAQIINNLHDSYVTTDLNGIITSWSSGAEKTLGYSAREIIGQDISVIYFDDDREYIQEHLIAPLFRIGHCEAEVRVRTKMGNAIYSYLSLSLLRDERGEVSGMIGVAMDITSRVQAEEKLKQTTEQLRRLAARFESVREEERTSLSREVHDTLGQILTALKLDLSWFESRLSNSQLERDLVVVREKSGEMLQLVDEAIKSVQHIASQLRPTLLADAGLSTSIESQLRDFKRRTGIKYHFNSEVADSSLDRETAVALLRIFQEALTNIVRHANATQIDISLGERNGQAELSIIDNGRGIALEELSSTDSLGLVGMHERAFLVGGEVIIEGSPGQGTIVMARVPLIDREHLYESLAKN